MAQAGYTGPNWTPARLVWTGLVKPANSESIMKFLIIVIFVVIAVFVIRRRQQNSDPAHQPSPIPLPPLLRAHPDAGPQAIADIFAKHGIARSRCQGVGRLVMPKLRQHGLSPEDAMLTMSRVKAAYSRVPEGNGAV